MLINMKWDPYQKSLKSLVKQLKLWTLPSYFVSHYDNDFINWMPNKISGLRENDRIGEAAYK